MQPEDRPTFSYLVLSIDKTLTTVAGYVEFSMTLKQPESEEEQYEVMLSSTDGTAGMDQHEFEEEQYEVMLSTGGTACMDRHQLGDDQYEVMQPAGGDVECQSEKIPSSGNVL